MGLLWKEVQLGEDVFDMLPILHLQRVGLVNDDDLDRREEVRIMAALLSFAIPAVFDCISQTQRRRDDYVGTVEGRKEFHRFASKLQAHAEHVVVVAAEQLTKVF